MEGGNEELSPIEFHFPPFEYPLEGCGRPLTQKGHFGDEGGERGQLATERNVPNYFVHREKFINSSRDHPAGMILAIFGTNKYLAKNNNLIFKH